MISRLAPGVLVLASASIGGFVTGCGSESESFPPGVVVRLDGDSIRYDEFERYLAGVGEDPQSLEGSVMAALFLRFLDQQVALRLAAEDGLVPRSASAAVAESLLLDSLEIAEPTDEEVSMALRSRSAGAGQPSVTLRQLLLNDAEQAEAVVAAVGRGDDFVTAAAKVLGDPSAAVRSTLQLADLPQALREPIQQTSPGSITSPIEMQYGVHVFEVLEFHDAGREPSAAQVEDARLSERQRRRRARLEERLEEGWKRYNVQIARSKLPFVLAPLPSPAGRSSAGES